jgi:hypothetical protein
VNQQAFCSDYKQTIIDLYNSGNSLDEIRQSIATRLDHIICNVSIWNALHRWKIPLRKQGKVCRRQTELTSTAIEIINGLMLGDGYIGKQSKRQTNSLSVGTIVKEYSDQLQKILPFQAKIRVRPGGNGYFQNRQIYRQTSYHYRTSTDLSLNKIRTFWYPFDKKIIPQSLTLTPVTCIHWFYGDGSTSWIENNKVRMTFATNGFTKDEVEMLRIKLLEIDPQLKFNVNDGPVLVSARALTVQTFLDYIGSSEIEQYKYKWKYPKHGVKK